MSPVNTKVDSREARGRAQSTRARAALTRKARLRSLALEDLEARTLMATLPALIATGAPTFIVGGGNASDGNKVDDSSPTITINPSNPLQMVTTYATRDPNIQSPDSFFQVGAQYSLDGGTTWNNLALPPINAQLLEDVGATPSTATPPPRYTETDDAVAAWDTKNNLYLMTTSRTGDNSAGAVYLKQFDFSSGNPTAATFPPSAQPPTGAGPIGSQAYQVVYFWNQTNLPQNAVANNYPGVLNATIAVDNNVRVASDPDVVNVQSDNFTDVVHIAWVNDRPPPATPPSPYNRYTIEIFHSDNTGGTAFDPATNKIDYKTAQRISGGNSGNGNPIAQYSSPKIAISQQSSRTGITGGQVTVVYDDFGSLSSASPPQDAIFAAVLNPNLGGTYSRAIVTQVATTAVRGTVTPGNFSFGTAITSKGIGPGAVIAADNTLGAFSPMQGRIYVAYVDHAGANHISSNANDADNTDIYLSYSDNGGTTWVSSGKKNDDFAQSDGYTGSGLTVGNGPAGRPQFEPSIAVDQSSGTLVLSYFDARDDASRARVVTSIAASIDGGSTFSPAIYANAAQSVKDAISNTRFNLGPIPDNESGGNPNSDGDRGFGGYQGLAVLNGTAYPVWASNLNGGTTGTKDLGIAIHPIHFAAGPRIIASTMGPVQALTDGNGNTYNGSFASDGTQQFDAFSLTFDRAIDPNSFTYPSPVFPSGPPVSVSFERASDGATFGVPVNKIELLNGQWIVRVTPQAGVGTYSYTVLPVMRDLFRTFNTNSVLVTRGNLLDQNADGTPGDVSNPNGFNNDIYENPRHLVGLTLNTDRYDNTTIPIIVPGPHVVGTDVPGAPFTSDNLVLNQGVSSLDVTFDRNINPATFTNVDVLRIQGPLGIINGPTTFQSGPAYQGSNLGALIPDNTATPLDATLTIPSSAGTFKIDKLAVNLSIAHANVSQLVITLIAPDGTQVPLILQNGGTGANLTNTTFDDSAGLTFSQGVAPYTNVYRPTGSLTSLQGKIIDGKWTLRIFDVVSGVTGTLTNWSLVITPQITVTPLSATTFRVLFPQQLLNGTYSIVLGSDIQSTAGDSIDNNLNAGLSRLRGVANPSGASIITTYNSAAVPIRTNTANLVNNVLVPGEITSTLLVNDDYSISNATLSLNIVYPNDPDLEAFLVAPDGVTTVQLFSKVGNVGPLPRSNFNNTVFDDAASTNIANGGPPFIGSFQPQSLLTTLNGLNVLNGLFSKGTWTLHIRNYSTSNSGTLTAWSLNLKTGQLASGLGETIADQSAASFRIFTMDPTNATSTTTWTAVGPAGIGGSGTSDRSSRIGGLALDPSDPSGNTVFLGGASGGIWKTSNFLTASGNGPTWIPLTDYGPTFSLNVGGLAAFGRNNDPKQTIVFGATGEGDAGSGGVGFLKSMDGGATWAVLDSSVNVDAAGHELPINSPLRDHIFLGSSSFKIVVDPNPTPSGEVIIYAALSGGGNQAGVWRSQDTGKTWQRVLAGQATDVVLDPNSGTLDAISNPTGNLRILYAGLRGDGVYASTNGGGAWNQLVGGVGDPFRSQVDVTNGPPVPVNGPPRTPNGPKGRIVLAKPNLTGNARLDSGYEGWLYAAVATPNDHLDGLYVSKDYGQNWTAIRLPSIAGTKLGAGQLIPTNDPSQPDYDPTGGGNFGQANYDLSLVVDPNHPEVVYLGGSLDGNPSGLIRIDITYLQDAHSFFLAQNDADGGQRESYAQGGVALKTPNNTPTGGFGVRNPLFQPLQNFYRDPVSANATSYVIDTTAFFNTGQGVRFIPYDGAVGDTDQHRVFAFRDPLTGLSRLVFGYDQGVSTAVDRGDGTFVTTLGSSSTNTNFIGSAGTTSDRGFVLNHAATTSDLSGANGGTVSVVSGTRNGNLQINQMYYGASQPSVNAGLTARLRGLFYFMLQDNGFPQSDPNILSNGNLLYSGAGGDGAGVATDQTGSSGNVFQYKWPCCGGNTTDFFQVNGIGRTNGLIQQSGSGGPVPDPQWPFLGGANFEVNPISPGGKQIIISSTTGNIFRTQDTGLNWKLIGDKAILDSSQALALAYGAPDPTSPGYNGQTDNFIYIGTNRGHIFLTRSGGGAAVGTSAWIDISAGLDGTAIQKIVTDPTRGSGDAYAVTAIGVYRMVDSRAANPTWINVTGNLLALNHNSFGNVSFNETLARNLTSLQADWRYAIPNNLAQPSGPAHPVLYVGADAGVYRSFDNGTTWTIFPDIATNGSLANGGYLPNAHVTDLDLSLGNIDPTTGRPFASNASNSNSNPNVLLASTYGRGAFAIRLAPIVFQSSVGLDPTLPSPGGSQGTVGANGLPKITFATPFIQGFSAQTAFGYQVKINLVDLTGVDLNDPVAIANATTLNIIGTGFTDPYGKFSIQISPGKFAANGVKVIGVQAIDGSGTKGNVAITSFILAAANLGLPTVPITPTLGLLASDNTGPVGQNITRINTPHLTGHTDPFVTVEILDSVGNIVNSGTSDNNGNFSLIVPKTGTLVDGTYTFFARARNVNGTSAAPNPSITFTIKTTTPPAPTLNILPADDTGVKGDGITASRRPHLIGVASPGGTVNLYQVINGTPSNVPLSTTTAIASGQNAGQFSIQLPFDLTNGSITLVTQAFDNAGNPSAFSPIFALKIVTVNGDYNNDGAADFAVFRPTNANWYEISAPGNAASGFAIQFGAADPQRDVPIQGDFEGRGKTSVAIFRPSTATWFIQRPTLGSEVVQFGQPGVDIPVPGDYDGDGVTDLAVWRPTTDTFYVAFSSGGGLVKQFGWVGHDTPVPADYDGTGKAQIAVYRAETSQWFINGVAGSGGPISFGSQAAGDVPVPADYTGTGHASLAVYRATTGQYFIKPTATGGTVNTVSLNLGTITGTEVPVPLDYDGDGKVDPAVYQGSTATWVVQRSTAGPLTYAFGWPGHDIAIPGSYHYKLTTNVNTTGGSLVAGGAFALSGSSQHAIASSQVLNVAAPATTAQAATTIVDTSTVAKATIATSAVTTPVAAAIPNAVTPTTTIRRRTHPTDTTGHHAQIPGGPRKLAHSGLKGMGQSKTIGKAGHAKPSRPSIA